MVPLIKRMVLLAVACMVIALPAACSLRTGANPTTLTYKLPTTITVPVGNLLPGTNIRYIGATGEDANILIGDQIAHKRKGDSLNWSGKPLDGVAVELKLRVIWYTETELRLVGTAKLVIDNIAPHATTALAVSEVKYSGAAAYGMAKGAMIPGTTISYEGKFEEGAKLGGVADYPYRQEGDSIQWEGTLRPGVYAQFSLRVAQFDSRGLRVVGTVSVWLEV